MTLTTLKEFEPEATDMFTVVIIGNSQTYNSEGRMVTPRGYYRDEDIEADKIGQEIMIKSFRTIDSELQNRDIPLGKKWSLLHAIHTTADFDMENILYVDEGAVEGRHVDGRGDIVGQDAPECFTEGNRLGGEGGVRNR